VQALIATWMLQTRIDSARVQTVIELLKEDMQGF